MIRFLQKLLTYSQQNQLVEEFLTMIFARVLIGGFVTDEEVAPLKKVVAQEVIVNMIRFLLSERSSDATASDSNSE